MPTPEEFASIAEQLLDNGCQRVLLPLELARHTGCPIDIPPMVWLARHGYAKRTSGGWRMKLPTPGAAA
jgi:hypothetical protein